MVNLRAPRARLSVAFALALLPAARFGASAEPAQSGGELGGRAGHEAAGEAVANSEVSGSSNPFDELARAAEQRLVAAVREPAAIAALIELVGLAANLPDGRLETAVRPLLQAAGEGGGADPLVVAHAREMLARRKDMQGDGAAAAGIRSELGLLTRFSVAGPFGDGRASFGIAFGPEQMPAAPNLGERYPGKEREVGWRSSEGAVLQGALFLDAMLRPATQAAAYALTWVKVDRATPAALRLGSPGPLKVWCNGRLVHASDVVRTPRFDQDAVAVELGAGWNAILIKTVVTEGAWRLVARLTTLAGTPLAFESAPAAPDGEATPPIVAAKAAQRKGERGSARQGSAPRSLWAVLLERARRAERSGRRGPAAAMAYADLGRYLAAVDPADRERNEARRAYERAADLQETAEVLLGLADASREEDERRRALERALPLAVTPIERARVLAALGDVAREQRRDALAIERWRAALDAEPGWWPAALALAEEEQAAGLPAAALARLESLPPVIRGLPRVVRFRARLNAGVERNTEALRLWRQLASSERNDLEVLRELADAARVRGAADEAIALAARAAALRPDLHGLTMDWARALEGAGRAVDARAALEAATGRLPDEPALHAELGRLLDRSGDVKGALVAVRAAVALRPQDADLRRYAEAIERRSAKAEAGHAGEDLARRFAEEVESVLASEAAGPEAGGGDAAGAPSRRSHPPGAAKAEDPAVVLLDRRVVRVHGNGLSETFAQRIVRIETDKGAEDYKDFYITYTPGREEVEVIAARIVRRDDRGKLEVIEAPEREDEDLSEPWYGLYYDHRAEVVRFDGLRAGDVLEVQYLVSNVARENQMGGTFGDLQFVAEAVPKRRWEYVLIAPPKRAFHFSKPRVQGLVESRHVEKSPEDGGETVYRFGAAAIPKLEVEPAMPGLADVAPYLHVSTYASWREVGTWYWRLIEEQLVADDAVRRAAREAVRPEMSDEAKVRALHTLVVTGTRYVGLEFGIHGFRPYRVSQVLARRFGDCKDKAALLVTLLREVGIEAEMTLLRTRQGGHLDRATASLAAFDHAIAFVPKLGLYLDGTAEFAGMRELPAQDQGVMGLRVGPRGPTLVETPVLPSSDNRAVRRWNATIDPSGDAAVAERLTITGQAAPAWRAHYQTEGERRERYGKAWTTRYPGARLVSVEMPGLADRERPVTVAARATIPGFAAVEGARSLALPLAAREPEFARTYARLSERKTDLVLAYPWQHDEEIVYRLPPGLSPVRLPQSRSLETPFGRFTLSVRREGAALVRVRATLDVRRHRIPAGEYPQFRRFLVDVDGALSERIPIVAQAVGARQVARAAP